MIENYVGKMNTLFNLTILISVHGQTALIRTLRGDIERRVLRINGASVLNRLNLEKM